jgi:outer membrane autotransporter protein
MKKKLLAVLCCAAALLFLNTAHAADGPYVGFNVGAAMLTDSDVTDSEAPGDAIELSYDNGWTMGAAVGYRLNNFRVEGEISYQKNDIDETSAMGFSMDSSGDVSGLSFLVNGYYDFANQTAFTPFLSAGLGYARVEVNDYNLAGSGFADFNEDDSVFAYQFGAGVGYAVNESITIDLKYRYFTTSDPDFDGSEAEIASHNILLGLRYSF